LRILRLNKPPVTPKISLVLVDWSVRESFHIIDYLKKQSVIREDFEIIIIEFFDSVSPALKAYENDIDTWILLEIPKNCYYHKHVMYNAGIIAACGDIVMIGDSDAMVRETFIHSIINTFKLNPDIILHLDQYRNNRQDLYPFKHPTFDEIIGKGCINNGGGKTTGMRDEIDPLHSRNYGACMSAYREDLISIGGADEHIDFVGHICGPYDLTFRLINSGKKEMWHENEFTYHSWHPGAAGVDNYQGPHDGKQMSSTSLEALFCGRVQPLKENPAIAAMRSNKASSREDLLNQLLKISDFYHWEKSNIISASKLDYWSRKRTCTLPTLYHGHKVELGKNTEVYVTPLCNPDNTFMAPNAMEAFKDIRKNIPWRARLSGSLILIFILSDRIWKKLVKEIFNKFSL